MAAVGGGDEGRSGKGGGHGETARVNGSNPMPVSCTLHFSNYSIYDAISLSSITPFNSYDATTRVS